MVYFILNWFLINYFYVKVSFFIWNCDVDYVFMYNLFGFMVCYKIYKGIMNRVSIKERVKMSKYK